jgi:hypothetical protein
MISKTHIYVLQNRFPSSLNETYTSSLHQTKYNIEPNSQTPFYPVKNNRQKEWLLRGPVSYISFLFLDEIWDGYETVGDKIRARNHIRDIPAGHSKKDKPI